jgi:hypothetical protein
MAEGLSFESFAGLKKVSRQTIYDWADKHPEFLDAKNKGFEANRLFYERAGVQQVMTGQGSATALIFNLKNRFPSEWRDRRDDENTKIEGPVYIQFDGVDINAV